MSDMTLFMFPENVMKKGFFFLILFYAFTIFIVNYYSIVSHNNIPLFSDSLFSIIV
jgi:hypothetical protein